MLVIDGRCHRRDRRLDILVIGADIADMRKGEGDDLPGIGRVGQDFLIAGDRGVEADFADRCPRRPDALPPEYRAIRQNQGRVAVGRSRRGPGRGRVFHQSCILEASLEDRRCRVFVNPPVGELPYFPNT
jgi:hypothetical protein